MASQRTRLRRQSVPAIRNRLGKNAVKVSATEAKNRFGDLLDSVLQGSVVLITRHATPKAVLLSMQEYESLSRAAGTRPDSSTGEFDAVLERMQTSKARDDMKAAFAASPTELGKAAVAAARKRANK